MSVSLQDRNSLIKLFYQERGWRIRKLNITYFRDTEPDRWTPNNFAPDKWNCTRVLWSPDANDLILSCLATTRPGVSAVERPMNANGTFSILHNHLHKDCWVIDRHITKSSNQLALVQCDTIIGTRDSNKDYMISGDRQYSDAGGVNQHTTNNKPVNIKPLGIGGFSYGCLVGAFPVTHYNEFMPALIDSGLKTFDTGIIFKDAWSEFIERLKLK